MDRRARPGARPQVSSRAPGGGRRDRDRRPRYDVPPPSAGPVLTPLWVTLAIALVIGFALLGYALLVQRGQDVPFLAAACAVTGLAFAAWAVSGAIATYRAASRGRGGRAFGLALVGGIAAIGAFGFLALATIFGILWRSPT